MLRSSSSTVLLSFLGLAFAASTFACSASSGNDDVDSSLQAVQQKTGKPTGDGKTCSWGDVGISPVEPPVVSTPPSTGSSGGCSGSADGTYRCWSYDSDGNEVPVKGGTSGEPAPMPPVMPEPPPPVRETYELGDWFPALDGCNRCTCTEIGIMCTVQVCPAPPPPPPHPGCELDGKSFGSGERFSPDGCNTCSCGPNGEIACTQMACEPPTEPKR